MLTDKSSTMRLTRRSLAALLLGAGLSLAAPAATLAAPYLILGLDQKQVWNDEGERVLFPTGNDKVVIIDIARPKSPRIVAALPIENSVAGPPVNLAISPDNRLALVADSYTVVAGEAGSRIEPTNKLFVIDLATRQPRLVQTLIIGSQPSGLSINPAGTLALVGYRADNAVGVLKIEHGRVREVDRVLLGDSISHVAFTADGRRAIAVHHDSAKVTILNVEGDTVAPAGAEIGTTTGVYVAEATPNGRLALTIDKGFVTVVDLQATPPRAIDRVPVSPGGEGLAISPRGDLAVTVSLRGSNGDKRAHAFHERGAIDVLAIRENRVTRVRTIEVGRVPEAAAFSPDGKYLYIGNFLDSDLWIFRVNGSDITDTGRRLSLPGRPASGRASPSTVRDAAGDAR